MSQVEQLTGTARAWTPVLDRIDAELADTLGRTIQPAQAVPPGPPQDQTALLDAHLSSMDAGLAQTGRLADEADAALAEAAAALDQWRDRAAALQRRLAEWATRAL